MPLTFFLCTSLYIYEEIKYGWLMIGNNSETAELVSFLIANKLTRSMTFTSDAIVIVLQIKVYTS